MVVYLVLVVGVPHMMVFMVWRAIFVFVLNSTRGNVSYRFLAGDFVPSGYVLAGCLSAVYDPVASV